MNKSTQSIFIIILILVVLLAIFLYFNSDNLDKSKYLYTGQIVEISHNDNTLEYDFESIKELKEYTFSALLNESGKDPVNKEYTGVLLKELIEDANIANNYSAVIVSAVDGYTVMIEKDKILEDDNVYLAYKQDGERLKSRDEDGVGPFLMVISKDQFSQYWCKYVTSIEVID